MRGRGGAGGGGYVGVADIMSSERTLVGGYVGVTDITSSRRARSGGYVGVADITASPPSIVSFTN